MHKTLFVLAASFLAASAGAAANKPSPDPAPAQVDPRIGEEVDRICFARNINGWKEVKGVDNAVLLESGVNDWHYVTLSGACEARVFRFAHAIGIDNRPGGGCVHKGDAIVVEDNASFTRRCFIRKIYKWNDAAPAAEDAPPAEQ